MGREITPTYFSNLQFIPKMPRATNLHQQTSSFKHCENGFNPGKPENWWATEKKNLYVPLNPGWFIGVL